MRPIEILMEEHQVILSVLDALVEFTERLDQYAQPDLSDLEQFGYFFQDFADKYHHSKEEDYLFVEMVNAGFPEESGPVSAMLMEHDEGRRLVGKMMDATKFSYPLDRKQKDELIQDLMLFIDLLRGHIFKEDQILYPMSERAISDQTFAEMETVFDRLEAESDESGQLKAMHKMADTLLERYVPAV